MHGDHTPPQLPSGGDDLEARLLALREVTSTIPLASPTRVRARGEARRRHQATAVVTGCALAAAAVVVAVAGLPGRPLADAPPADPVPSASSTARPSTTPSASSTPSSTAPTNTSTTKTSSSTTSRAAPAVTRPAGDTSLIVPPGEIDGIYFLGGNVWTDLGLGRGQKVTWHEAFDWEGGVAVYSACDAEADVETGGSDLTNVGILNLSAKQGLGRQRVRLLDDADAGRAYLKEARTRLLACPAVWKRATDGTSKLTVTEHPELGEPDGDRPMAVYRTVTDFGGDTDRFVEWIVMGYTQSRSGRTLATVLSTSQEVDAEIMRDLGRAALERIANVA